MASMLALGGYAQMPSVGTQNIVRRDPPFKPFDPYPLQSGVHDGDSRATRVAFSAVVHLPDSPWMRIHIADAELGKASFVRLTSLLDGDTQTLAARHLADWSHSSGIFNGEAIELELHVAPHDRGVFVNIDSIWRPELDDTNGMPDDPGGPGPRSLCGGDNRVASSDSRVARLGIGASGGCTGWLVYNGVALSAGHCGIAVGDILEFNVPASLANGQTVVAALIDQYPVTQVAAENDGVGADWAAMVVGANSISNLRPHIAQGWFRMTDVAPPDGTTIRVTGYGLDNTPGGAGGAGAPCCDADDDGDCDNNCNAASRTLQTATGPYDDFSGGGTIHEYEVDTTPANSGSPVIWNSSGIAIGIHTTGGCDSALAGYDNEGTAFAYNALENVINDAWTNVVYVDSALTGVPETGTIFEPYGDVAESVAAVPTGGIVYLVPASYSAAGGNVFTAGADGKAMTLLAFVGSVTIGD
jgi:V8-like Glu-specific endopeptidase